MTGAYGKLQTVDGRTFNVPCTCYGWALPAHWDGCPQRDPVNEIILCRREMVHRLRAA